MQRRKLLKGAVAGIAAGLAGCGGQQGDGGGDGESPADGGGDTPTATPPEATPEPGEEEEFMPVRELHWWSLPRSNQADIYEYGVLARKNWERLGLDINWQVMENSQRISKLFNHEYDVEQLKWAETPEVLRCWYNLYYSAHSDNVDSGNLPEFQNEDYDAAVDRFRSTFEHEQRVEAAHEAQEILADQTPVVYLVSPDALAAANTGSFTNWQAQAGGYNFLNTNTFRDLEATGDASTLIYGTDRTVRGFPNFMGIGASPEAWVLYKQMYDSLTELDYGGEVYGRAAEDWEIEDDTTYTFTLREGLTFADGEPLTAEDVAFSWNYITEYGIPWMSSDYAEYESNEVVDERTIRFNMKQPFAPFIGVAAYRMPILPKHIWDGVVEENNLEHPRQWTNPDTTGSGPLQLQEFEPKNRAVFEKHDGHFWADEIPFDTFVQRIYGSQTAAVGDLQRDRIQFMQSMVPAAFEQAEKTDGVKAVNSKNIRVDAVFFMNTVEPFDELDFRKALAHATNKQDIIEIVYDGRAVMSPTQIAPGNETFYNSDVTFYEGDLQQAQDILQEAGYKWDEEGNLLKPKSLDDAPLPPPAQ